METATIAMIGMIASSAATAGMGVVQGIQSSRAAKLEQAQYEDEARSVRLAADQEEVQRRKQLERILAHNETLKGWGTGRFAGNLNSGSYLALRDSNISEAEDDISTGRMNRMAQARRSDLAAFGASQRARGGLFSGAGAVISGLGTAATGLQRYKG